MNKSESIANVCKALCLFQGEVVDVYKGKQAYNYSYADLTSVLNVCRPLCAKYGLAVTQLCVSHPDTADLVGIETVLLHESGEWLGSVMYMPVQAAKGMVLAQASGSVISYCRRYALAAIMGISQTDNDAALEFDELPQQKAIEAPPQVKPISGAPEEGALYRSLKLLVSQMVVENKMTKEDAVAICTNYNVATMQELSDVQIREVIKSLESK